MSGSLRIRIGQKRRWLRIHIGPVQSMLDAETSTDSTPLGDRSNDDLLDDTALLISVRSPFVKAYRSLLQDHEAWIALRTTKPEEEKEYTKYIGKVGDYSAELQEASDVMSRVDSLLEKFVAECRTRDLQVATDDDALTTATGQTESIAPLPRPRNHAPSTPSAPSGETKSQLPGRTITTQQSGDVTVEVEEVEIAPPFGSTKPHTEVVYVRNDSASAFVTAALVGKSLPHFSGDLLNWPEFFESFTSLVRNGNISGGDKLALLRMCLGGEAQEVIAGLSQVDRNFEHAIMLLKKEYDRPHHRHHALLTRIRNLPNCDRDGRNLRSFSLKLNVLIRQLLPNGELDSPDLLVNMITSKLPVAMQARIIKESSRKADFGVYNVLAILADAVDDERIERDIMASRVERRTEKSVAQPATPATAANQGHSSASKASRRQKQNRFSDGTRSCRLCAGIHGEDSCTTYTTPEDRRTAAFQRQLCMNCLLPGHRATTCPSKFRCRKCKDAHHSSTCMSKTSDAAHRQGESVTARPKPATTTVPVKTPAGKSSPRPTKQQTNCVLTDELYDETTMSAVQQPRDSTQPLLCMDIDLRSPTNPEKTVRTTVIFDSASSCSYVSTALAAALDLPTTDTRRIKVRTFGKKRYAHRTVTVYPVSVPLNDGSTYTVTCLSSPLICGEVTWIKKENGLLTPTSTTPHLLLGNDYFLDLFFGDNFTVSRTEEGYYILSTAIGDVAASKRVSRSAPQTVLSNPVVYTESMDLSRLEEMVHRHFSLEMMGVTDSPAVDADDGKALTHFLANIRYNAEEKRYYVALPFREDNPQLPTNFGLAFKRLVTTVNGLAQRPENLEKYGAIFKEQLENGILEEVPPTELYSKERVHYLSHFGIVKESSATTKLRAVLDGSAHSKESPSLNSCLYRGPVILPDLIGSLLRARSTPILLCADIQKAFLMVGLDEQSRDFTRLLWIRDPSLPLTMDNIVVYRFRRVPFGLNCSPFLLAGTLRYHLDQNPNEWADMIRETYVDNYFGHATSTEEGIRQFHGVREFFAKGSFNLREFVSNSSILNDLFLSENAAASNLEFAKILGLCWSTKADTLSLPPVKTPSESTRWTKRLILRHTASIFDALGFLVPATLPLKIFLQQLVKMKLDWDTLLPDDLLSQWEQRLRDFHSPALSFAVPRMAIPVSIEGSTIELHVFVDASQFAYAAVAYLVCRQPDGFGTTSLLMAKARVAPVKDTVSIPRLELMANLLGALLAHHIAKEMTTILIASTTIWTDSMISLCWIKNQAKKELPVFVRNRVIRISTLVPNASFKHVEGTQNPADVASRGCSTEELKDHPIWWKAPPFLSHPPATWNPQPAISASATKETTMAALALEEPLEEPVPAWMEVSRFGRWTKMVNTLVFILIFIMRLRKVVQLISRSSLYQKAENLLFTMAQQEFPPSPLLRKQLRMFRCSSTGLWRCHGRIENAEIPDEAKDPVYLPRDSLITRLFILHLHEAVHHFGEQHTLIELRQRVWIPKGLSTVKSALRHCMSCKRTKAKPFCLPEFPALPTIRTAVPAHPYSAVGLDLAGPLYHRSEGGERRKCWIMVLTCLHTRATYLDLICDMSTRTLLSRLRRFVATYGAPAVIYCDNAQGFVALGQLQAAFQQPEEHSEVVDYCAKKGIEFIFITPFAPWSGGIYERIVGLTKTALKAVLHNRLLQLEDLDTLLKECEAVLNTRPLTTYTGSDLDFTPLRPSDFLRPQARLALPRLIMEGEDDNEEWRPRQAQTLRNALVDGWKRSLTILSQFWTRWRKEYLTSLRERYQRNHPHGRLTNRSEPQCNDVVLIAEEGLERGKWRIGRIIAIKDARSAVVKTSSGTLHRSLSLLYKMEIESPTEHENVAGQDDDQPPWDAPNKDNTIPDTDRPPWNTRAVTPEAAAAVDRPALHERGLPPTPPTEPRPVRRSARLNPTLVIGTLLSIILLSCPVSATAPDSKCPDASSARTQLVYVTPCTLNGIGVAKIEGDEHTKTRICWMRLQCPRGHLLLPSSDHNTSHVCGPECACPKWTRTCSHYRGRYRNDSSLQKIPQELRDFIPPHVCSFKKANHCDTTALHGLFSRVELMDGSTFVVPKLDLTSTDTYSADDYQCVDINGQELLNPKLPAAVTGTSAFCVAYPCTSPENATAFCFYGGKVTSLVFLDVRIPLRAWGYMRGTYYPHLASTTPAQPSNVIVVCSRLGAEVHRQDDTQEVAVRACISSHCVFIQDWMKDSPTPVLFPWSIVSADYDIVIHQWTQGVAHPEFQIRCRGRSTCERLRCRFCSEFAWSPSCWSDLEAILFLFALLFIAGFIARIIDFCKMVSCFLRGVHHVLCCLFRKTSYDPALARVQPSARFYVPRKFRWKRGTIHLALCTMLLIPSSRTCSEVTSVRAEEHECTRSKEGSLDCVISQSSVLSLRPIGQETCLVVRDSVGAIGTILSLRINHITHRCDKQTMYFTRSHTFQTKSHHVCGETWNSGSCDDIRCSGLDPKKTLPFFDSSSPGYNVCASSCSCITCNGCFSCTPSCVFYRLYANPSSDKIFEVFRCLQWVTYVSVHIRIEVHGGGTSEHVMELRPGETSSWNDLKLTLLSTSIAPSPILSSHFLSDGIRTCLVENAAPSLFTPGSAGQLQCGTRENASLFRCEFRSTVCACSTSSTSATCDCPQGDLERFFKEHHTLPLERQGLRLVPGPAGLEAHITDNSILQLKVSLDNLPLQTVMDINECSISSSTAVGCYNCLTGGQAEIVCTSSRTETSTAFTCIDALNNTAVSSIIRCLPQGHKKVVSFSSSSATLQLNCSFSCPGEPTKKFFAIEGALLFVDEVEIPSQLATSLQFSSQSRITPFLDYILSFASSFNLFYTGITVMVVLALLFSFPPVCGRFHRKSI